MTRLPAKQNKEITYPSSRATNVYMMNRIGGYTLDEIANILGISKSTVVRDRNLAEKYYGRMIEASADIARQELTSLIPEAMKAARLKIASGNTQFLIKFLEEVGIFGKEDDGGYGNLSDSELIEQFIEIVAETRGFDAVNDIKSRVHSKSVEHARRFDRPILEAEAEEVISDPEGAEAPEAE